MYRVKREDLKVTAEFTSGMDQKALSLSFEREAAMCAQDLVIAETNAERNALESYVLNMRGISVLGIFIFWEQCSDLLAKPHD